MFGAIDASGGAAQLQIFAAQVNLQCPGTLFRSFLIAACSRITDPQVVLVVLLVFQASLAPYIEAKLDVVSGALHHLLRGSNGLRLAGRNASDGRAGAVDVVWHGLLSAFPRAAPPLGLR